MRSPPRERAPTRRAFLGSAASACALLACGGGPGPTVVPTPLPPDLAVAARAAAERGVASLRALQDAAGRFPSATYGYLKLGQSLTPFVLDVLLDLVGVGVAVPSAVVGATLAGARALVDERGALGLAGPAADYPVYATALLLRCLGRLRPTGWEAAAAPLQSWLRSQQLVGNEWEGHAALGGFPMGSTAAPTPASPGHVDLSMTRRALQALRSAGAQPDDPALLLGRRFVLGCRAHDGGFLYSPVDLALNKGRLDGDRPLSYGSSTADGLLALWACASDDGVGTPDARVQDPARWSAPMQQAHARLLALHRVDENPGLAGGPMALFGPAMRGYYRAASAAVFGAWGGPRGWQEPLVRAVLAEERAGLWRNESFLQKEDDPIVATGFALSALAACLQAP